MSGAQDLSGAVLKGYQLEDRLGASSHSAVYRARGRAEGRSAVKVLDSQVEAPATLAERLRQAASTLAELAHPGIVPIGEVGRSGRLTFAAAPFVPGRTLEDLMEEGGLDNERAWTIVSRVADALDGAHGRGLVYEALKPVNILVDEGGHVRLAEFGMTGRRVGPLAIGASSYRLATPQYLAPEQVEGLEPDARTDVYALAVLLFELLTRTPLHAPRPAAEILQATLSGPPPSAYARHPGLPRGLDVVLARGMARDPEERPGSASELLEQVLTLPDEATLAARTAAARSGPARPGLAPATTSVAISVPKAPITEESMVSVLRRMGVPVYQMRQSRILTTYYRALLHYAKEIAGPRWPDVLAAAGLQDLREGEEPRDDGGRRVPVEDASRLAGAFDTVFGLDSLDLQGLWGRQVTEFWIRRNRRPQHGEVAYRLPFRIRTRPEQRAEDALSIFSRGMDGIRGERLTAWKRVDRNQFWLVHYDNLLAVGRRRPARSCSFWTAAVDAALRWAGLANGWSVEEAECGCVTGTYNCVFKIQRAAFR